MPNKLEYPRELIALQGALRRAAKFQYDDVLLDFDMANQLLDRLEKLEATSEMFDGLAKSHNAQLDYIRKLECVAETAQLATTETDKIKRAGYINGLKYALAALEEDVCQSKR